MHTHPYVSIAKAFSWRLVGTLITFVTAYWFTQNVTVAVSIGLVESLSKLFFFYVHERAWVQIIQRFFGRHAVNSS